MSKQPSTPIPLRVNAALEAKIEEAARLTGMAKSDVMRLALEIGFEDLRRINYDIGGAVVDAARAETRGAVKPVNPSVEAKTSPAA